MRFALLITIIVFAGLSVRAQIVNLRGTVIDENGAVVAGVLIMIKSNGGDFFKTHSRDDGTFGVNVPPGQVSVEIAALGFLSWRLASFQVPLHGLADLNSVVLKVDKNQLTTGCPDLCFDPDLEPVESGKPFLSPEIKTRPAPLPSLTNLKYIRQKKAKKRSSK